MLLCVYLSTDLPACLYVSVFFCWLVHPSIVPLHSWTLPLYIGERLSYTHFSKKGDSDFSQKNGGVGKMVGYTKKRMVIICFHSIHSNVTFLGVYSSITPFLSALFVFQENKTESYVN